MIGELMNFLEDGSWHTIDEFKEKFEVSEEYILKIVRFLEEYGFIDFIERERKVRIKPSLMKLPI